MPLAKALPTLAQDHEAREYIMSKLTAESAPARAAAGSYKTSADPKAQSVGGARDVTGASGLSTPAMHAPAPCVAGAVAGVPVAAPASIPSTTQQRADELQNQETVAIRDPRQAPHDRSGAASYVQEGPARVPSEVAPLPGVSMHIPVQVGQRTVYASLDGGAQFSVITQNLVAELGLEDLVEEALGTYTTASGQVERPAGKIRGLEIVINHYKYILDLIVTRAVTYDMLLGMDFQKSNRVTPIWDSSRVRLCTGTCSNLRHTVPMVWKQASCMKDATATFMTWRDDSSFADGLSEPHFPGQKWRAMPRKD